MVRKWKWSSLTHTRATIRVRVKGFPYKVHVRLITRRGRVPLGFFEKSSYKGYHKGYYKSVRFGIPRGFPQGFCKGY